MVSGFPLWIHDTPGGRVVPSLVLTVPSSCDIPLDFEAQGIQPGDGQEKARRE